MIHHRLKNGKTPRRARARARKHRKVNKAVYVESYARLDALIDKSTKSDNNETSSRCRDDEARRRLKENPSVCASESRDNEIQMCTKRNTRFEKYRARVAPVRLYRRGKRIQSRDFLLISHARNAACLERERDKDGTIAYLDVCNCVRAMRHDDALLPAINRTRVTTNTQGVLQSPHFPSLLHSGNKV